MIIKSKSKSYQNKALSRPNLGPRLQTVRGEYCENARNAWMLPLELLDTVINLELE